MEKPTFISAKKTQKLIQKHTPISKKTKTFFDCRELHSENDLTFQQVGAPSHTSHSTQNYLRLNVPGLVEYEWPPQSPD